MHTDELGALVGKMVNKYLKLHPFTVSKKNIALFKCNKPSLIVKDLRDFCGVDPAKASKILLARGVGRLFVLRRKLLQFDKSLSKRMTADFKRIESGEIKRPNTKKVAKVVKDYYRTLGRLEALREIRSDIDKITSLKGFVIPDNDSEFENLLHVKSSTLIKD